MVVYPECTPPCTKKLTDAKYPQKTEYNNKKNNQVCWHCRIELHTFMQFSILLFINWFNNSIWLMGGVRQLPLEDIQCTCTAVSGRLKDSA